MRRGYIQEDLASKVGIINQRIYEYEQGRDAVSLEMLDEIAKVLFDITHLLPETRENENSEAEQSRLIEEYKKIKRQELRHVFIKSLFESIQVCKEKVERVERMKIAKNLVKEGISINIFAF